jgi:predicted metalloendopeptidase
MILIASITFIATGGSKETAMEMVDYIHREFLQILNEVDWMDEDTRQRGIEKGNTRKH